MPLWASAVLPGLDIVAITVLREASPEAAFSLLWVFPALWSAWVWGLTGAIGATVEITLIYWLMIVVNEDRAYIPAAVLLPLVIGAAAALSYLFAQRTTAQRTLLERQSAALRNAVERATREEAVLEEVFDAVHFGVAKVDAGGEVLLANAPSTALRRMRDAAGEAVFAAARISSTNSPGTAKLATTDARS